MATKTTHLDAAFVDKQRRILEQLRRQLLSDARDSEAEETAVNDESAGAPHEYEEDAQRLAALELDGNRVVRDLARLEQVDRALTKIKEGTYGVSDISGQHIPPERLEAVPESIYTLAEEKTRELKSR